jgi:hypothetical protein
VGDAQRVGPQLRGALELVERLGNPASLNPDSAYSTVRWNLDGETVVAAISEPKPGKTLVALTRSRILDGDSLDTAKEQLRDILGLLDAPGGGPQVD